jgi:hypothetical protein
LRGELRLTRTRVYLNFGFIRFRAAVAEKSRYKRIRQRPKKTDGNSTPLTIDGLHSLIVWRKNFAQNRDGLHRGSKIIKAPNSESDE